MEVSDTIKRIDEIIQRVNVHPEYSVVVGGEVRSALRGDATKHSIQLEHEAKGIGVKTREKEITKDLRNLDAAWHYLTSHSLDLATLSRLGGIIAPKENNMTFRFEGAKIGETDPASCGKVYNEVDNLIWAYHNIDVHPIIRGINLHLETARIHPWIDGNGRAARLLETYSNEASGYPPAIIYASDFELYKRVLRDALKDRNEMVSSFDKPSEREKVFNHFIESKILASARHLEEELMKRRHYDVELSSVRNKPIAMNVRNRLQAIGRRPGNYGVKVHIENGGNRKNTYSLRVSGDVGLKDIRRVLEEAKDSLVFRYRAESVKGCFENKGKHQ